jgi:S-adenosylmethionine synthetase
MAKPIKPALYREDLKVGSLYYIDEKLRPRYPAVGQDIKIMGLRDRNTITLTIACAIVDKYCGDISEYSEYMALLSKEISHVAQKMTNRKVSCMSIPPTI